VHPLLFLLHPAGFGVVLSAGTTWAPFRLQFYFNGHHHLANVLQRKGFSYRLLDNAFAEMEDFQKAQQLSEDLQVKRLHRRLDQVPRRSVPSFDTSPRLSLEPDASGVFHGCGFQIPERSAAPL